MTNEEKINKLLTSKPYYVMCGPDENGNAMYGCVTDEGKQSFYVTEDTMFAGFPNDEKEESIKAWRHKCAKRMGALRGNLLHCCLGKFVDNEEIKADTRVGEFLWMTIHNSGEPVKLEHAEFLELFKPCSDKPDVTQTLTE